MTTREEFALAFATSAYAVVMKTLLEAAPGRECPSMEQLEQMDRDTIKGAVEMADMLIAELEKPAKAQEPPLKA